MAYAGGAIKRILCVRRVVGRRRPPADNPVGVTAGAARARPQGLEEIHEHLLGCVIEIDAGRF